MKFKTLMDLPQSLRSQLASWDDIGTVDLQLQDLYSKGIRPVQPTSYLERTVNHGCFAVSMVMIYASSTSLLSWGLDNTWRSVLLSWSANTNCGTIQILQFFARDIRLSSPCEDLVLTTFIEDPLFQHIPDGTDQLLATPNIVHPHFSLFQRLNLYASIPELNLVVAGSQIGRVGLLSLTRIDDSSGKRPVAMLRLDLILPFKHHEDEYRPTCPLLGLAVSPLQTNETRWDDEMKWRSNLNEADEAIIEDNPWLISKVRPKRRWRLILHVSSPSLFDNSILSLSLTLCFTSITTTQYWAMS